MKLNTQKVKEYLESLNPNTKAVLVDNAYGAASYFTPLGYLEYENTDDWVVNMENATKDETLTVKDLLEKLSYVNADEFLLAFESRVELSLDEPEVEYEVVSYDYDKEADLLTVTLD